MQIKLVKMTMSITYLPVPFVRHIDRDKNRLTMKAHLMRTVYPLTYSGFVAFPLNSRQAEHKH